MKNWARRRVGLAIGPKDGAAVCIGIEKRTRIFQMPFTIGWPTIWYDRPEPPLAPALKIDPEAFEARARRTQRLDCTCGVPLPDAAPGDTWACVGCDLSWRSADFGPLDITWEPNQ